MEIQSDFDALVMALRLALTAPDDDKAQQVAEMAEQIAARMSDIDIARAKREALQ